MANRAYLFAANQFDLHKSDFTELHYYDSRHIIPILWFLFFKPNSVKSINVKSLIRIKSLGDFDQEIRFIENKKQALENFANRFAAVNQYLIGKLQLEIQINFNKFISNIENWSGEYIVLDPNEIIESEDGIVPFEKALQILDKGGFAEFVNSPQIYTGTLSKSKDEKELTNCLIGLEVTQLK